MTVGFSLMTQLRVESSKARQYGFQVIYAIGGGVVSSGSSLVTGVEVDGRSFFRAGRVRCRHLKWT
jgi:hypothetical protein